MTPWYWIPITAFIAAAVGFIAGGTCAIGKRDDEERLQHQIRDINDGNWHGRRGA